AIESKSPVPFSVITHSEISKSYIYQDIPALLSTLPSIYSYSQNGNSIGYSILSLRGFDQRRVSVLINGIPQNDP
ncbi:MAG TPA: Plug domain-containing protein, partial [Candidatus Kapabacteria bacterium]|nr:Plug domain-containing protein [Candidatus Kapabacteria bacterium]